MNKLDRETTRPLFCEFCGEIFSESSAISPHFCHQEDAKSSEHQLKRKMSDGHVRLFDCGDCGLQCASKESLSTHRRYHSNQKRPKLNHSQLKNRKIHECLCPKCGIMVPSRFFGRHMKDEHPGILFLYGTLAILFSILGFLESPVKLWSVTDLSCDICSITLSSKSHLLAHIARFHEGSEFFSCPECSKVFQSR